jgi:hypothetical protein
MFSVIVDYTLNNTLVLELSSPQIKVCELLHINFKYV